eukprot:SAG11_NODE_2085_length_3847_cov_2.866329_5_plen_480_part_00
MIEVNFLLRRLGAALDRICGSRQQLDTSLVMNMFNISYLLSYIRITFCVDRMHRMLRPFVLPPSCFRDGAAVYVFVSRRSPGFYIGMAIEFYRRVLGHIRTVRALTRLRTSSNKPDGLFHAHVMRTGLGNFSVLVLVIFPSPQHREARLLAQASIRHVEAWFIRTLSRTHARTLNITGTWRRADEFRRYHVFGTPVAPLDERVAPAAGSAIPTKTRNSIVQFIVHVGGARVRCFDLYTVLASLATLPVRDDRTPIAWLTVTPGDLHITRFRSVRFVFGASILRLHQQNDQHTARTILGSDLRRQLLSVPRIDVITATRRASRTPYHTRRALARLLFDRTFAHVFERECTLLQLHHLYTSCKRQRHQRQAARRGRIVTICRRKFRLHPGLAMTLKVRTPLFATRRQLLMTARVALQQHSPLHRDTNAVVCRNLRVVFSRGRRVIDYFDNVRDHCKGYIVNVKRACICGELTQYWRHPMTG